MDVLEVKHLSKFYGQKAAINDVGFHASQGEVVGLVGHNGSGKSTTMRIISSVLSPSEGDVFIDGVSVTENPLAAKAKVGFLPEIPPVYPDFTVREQLGFAAGLRNIAKRDVKKEVEKVSAKLNLQSVESRLIGNLSKGYRQRVGFAQALLGDVRLLVLDEPTVGLDPEQIIELRELIAELRKNTTVLISSHILSEISATCDRIVLLSEGHIKAEGTVASLIKKVADQTEYILTVDEDNEKVAPLIQAVPGVISCTENSVVGDFHICAREDVHREILSLLARENIPICTFKPVEISLEDVFLHLSRSA